PRLALDGQGDASATPTVSNREPYQQFRRGAEDMPIPLMAPEPMLGQGPVLAPAPPAEPGVSALEIEVDDAPGKVTIRDKSEAVSRSGPDVFDDNLAETLDDAALGTIAEMLLRGIEADERSRKEMLEQYTRGMDLLGLKLEGDAAGFAAGQGG